MRIGTGLLLVGVVLMAWTCTPTAPKPEPQDTQLNGKVYNRSFADSRAAFATRGNPPAAVIRVLERADMIRDEACSASTDPGITLDPTLLLSVFPAETGTFPVISTTNPDAGGSTRYATATLYTFTDLPDGGGFDDAGDAGLRPVVRQAIGGEVKITALDPSEEGRLNATVLLEFSDGEAFSGEIGAVFCDAVQ